MRALSYFHLSDEELIRRILLESNQEFKAELYRRNHSLVRKICISFSKDAETCNELEQEAFLKIFSQLDKFQHKSKLSTWIYVLAHNLCIDHIRKNKRFRVSGLGVEQEEYPDDITIDLSEQMMKSLVLLQPHEYELLQLKYALGMSIRSIGEQYNLSDSSVKMRLKRAKTHAQLLYKKIL